ncbi:MAG: hypothetical protein WCA21_19535 [Terracidiphilus sp.]
MKFGKHLLFAALAAATLFIATSPSQAQEYGRHPAYLHALSDLRLMRAYLDKMTPSERIDDESQHAIDEIDAAIREIKEASIEDGKDLRDHAPIDAHITPSNRFRRAREAGAAALHDLDREEDNDFAHGLRHRAVDHIEKANHIVDHILHRFDNM